MSQTYLPGHAGNNIQSQHSDDGQEGEIKKRYPGAASGSIEYQGQYYQKRQESHPGHPLLPVGDEGNIPAKIGFSPAP